MLTNALLSLLTSQNTQHPNTIALKSALQGYQNIRKDRSKIFVNISGMITRQEALATLPHTLRFLFLKPLSTKVIADIQTLWYSTAPRLEHLPEPKIQEGNAIWGGGLKDIPKLMVKTFRAQ